MGYLLVAVVSYLIGSVNSAILVVWLKFHKDVRSGGSGNAGATNAARTYGLEAGLITLLGDVLKAVVACLIGKHFAGQDGAAIAGLFCLLGHCWPVFFRFRGGKGMAAAGGVLAVLDWRLLVVIAVFFVVVYLLWKRVSLSTVLSVLIFPPLYYFFSDRMTPLSLGVGTVICLLIVFQHRANIVRLINGTEPKLHLGHPGNGKENKY